MKFNSLLFRLATSFAALGALPISSAVAQTTSVTPTARVIVKYKADSLLLRREALAAGAHRLTAREALAQRIGVALRAGADVDERTQVVLASGMNSHQLAARLASETDVEYAVPDLRRHRMAVPNDPLYVSGPPVSGTSGGPASGQWYLRAPTTELRSAINAGAAWNYTIGSPGIVVADIDTGIRFDHPDLMRVANGGNLLSGYDFISDAAVANDGDGRDADPSDPGDWVTQAEITQSGGPFEKCADSPEDSSWHGTQTAGIIAALTNNGIGIASVGRTVRVLPVRVLGKCGGYDSDIVAAIRWSAGIPVAGIPANPTPARVINMSLGSDGECTRPYIDAIAAVNAMGVVVVVAAGNTNGHPVTSPGNCPGAIAVGGLRHAGTKVGYSSLGPEVAISAPAGNCVNTGVNDPCLYPIVSTSNAGTTSPMSDPAGGSIYTNAFNVTVGTSFSAPLVAGTAALLLSAQPSLTPSAVRSLLQSTARPFPTSGAEHGSGPIPACTAPKFDASNNPIDQDECYCNTSVCGAGMLDAGAAVAAALGQQPAAVLNFQGMWYAAPAESEAGWGIDFAHQGDVIFATWFTHDANGKGWYVTMTAFQTAPNTFTGTLMRTSGPALDAPFDPDQVQRTEVGSGTIAFSDANNGTFSYTVNGISQVKSITREVFGPLPTCTWGAQPNLALATNYTDMWWLPTESGWGVHLTQQGDAIFAAWFTYDFSGAGLSLTATLNNVSPGVYSGTLIRTSGPPFSAVPWDKNAVTRTEVGTATVSFANGNAATFTFTVNDAGRTTTQTKSITRQVFRAPGTVCQ